MLTKLTFDVPLSLYSQLITFVCSALWNGLKKITFEYGVDDVAVGAIFRRVPVVLGVERGSSAFRLLSSHPVADGGEEGGQVFQVVNARHRQLRLAPLQPDRLDLDVDDLNGKIKSQAYYYQRYKCTK